MKAYSSILDRYYEGIPAMGRGVTDKSSLAWISLLALLLSLGLALVMADPFGQIEFQAGPYAFVHALAEVAAVVVAAQIWAIGWNSQEFASNRNFLAMSTLFFGVAVFDFLHLMSYAGMPDFITPSGPSKAIFFWLAGRYFTVAALMTMVLLPWGPRRSRWIRHAAFAGVVAVIGVASWVGLARPELLPVFFVPGQGLMPVKLTLEYGIIGLLILLALVLARRALTPQPYHVCYLLAGVVTMIMSELCFVLYLSVTDAANLLGHAYKLLACYYFYRATFVEQVRLPHLRLRESEGRWRQLMDASPDGILVADGGGRIVAANPAVERIFGWSCQALVGRPVEILVPDRYQSDHEAQSRAYRRQGRYGRGSQREVAGRRSDGSEVPIEVTLAPAAGPGGAWVMAIVRDISARKRLEHELLHQANHDSLTGLPNRTLLLDRLDQSIAHASRRARPVAVVLIDLDGFKTINDSLGHVHGDRLLKSVGQRLAAAVRPGDTVGRLGGDEFVVLLDDLADEADVAPLVAKLLAAVAQPLAIDGHELFPTASAGVTLYPRDDMDADDLMRNADVAMFQAKKRGKGQYCAFTADMNQDVKVRLELLGELRHAVDEGQFVLHYQPKVSLASGAISGFEALVRWQHPQRGLVSPDRFIPLAEESGLILPLGQWVLRAACAQIRDWQDAGLAVPRVAVNLSAHQFVQADLVDFLDRCLTEAGLAPACLELEITESEVMDNVERSLQVLGELKRLGITLAIDDFGTGYSSFAYLRRLPVDCVKVDRAFVTEVPDNANDAAITGAIVSMAHQLGLQVVAEGVETERQLDFLRRHGCDEMQGYLFSKPLPADAAAQLLREGRRLAVGG